MREKFAAKWLVKPAKFPIGCSIPKPDMDVLLPWSDWEEENNNLQLATFLRYLHRWNRWPAFSYWGETVFFMFWDSHLDIIYHYDLPSELFGGVHYGKHWATTEECLIEVVSWMR